MLELLEDRVPRGIPVDHLCKHMFICGVPGSGKTTALFSLLLQLFARGITFVVIEAAKTEFRRLKTMKVCADATARGLAESLQVHTPLVEHLTPMRFNPLWRPPGVDPGEHIDQVMRCFRASMPMFEPLPALLDESLEHVYERRPDAADPPTMDELYASARHVLAGKRYSAELSGDLAAALEVRLGMLTRRRLGRLLRCGPCIPDIAQLMNSYSVIELDPLDTDVKCLLTLLLLTGIHQHVRLHPREGADSTPRLVVVIEEAHNIVGRCPDVTNAENQVDPKSHATDLICRMLAEFRALGVGLVLSDQSPSRMAPEVIKNTGTKLAFRHVHREDRQTLADAMLFGDLEFEEIARLRPGQAYLFAEGYHRALRVRTPNVIDRLHLAQPPGAGSLLSLMVGETWYQEQAARRAGEVLLRFHAAMDGFDRQMQAARHRLKDLLQRRVSLAQFQVPQQWHAACRELTDAIRRVGEELATAWTRLQRGSYAEVQKLAMPLGKRAAALTALRRSAVCRCDERLGPARCRIQEFVDRTVAQLNRRVFQKEESNGPKQARQPKPKRHHADG